MDIIVNFILGMPREAWMTAIAIVGIMGLLAIIKKAIRLGITVVILAVIITYGGMVVRGIQEEYDIQVNGSVVSATIDNDIMVIDLQKIESIAVSKNGDDKVTLSITSDDGLQANIDMPNIVYSVTQVIANKYDVEIKNVE